MDRALVQARVVDTVRAVTAGTRAGSATPATTTRYAWRFSRASVTVAIQDVIAIPAYNDR
jgi:hypothetical protein